MYYLSTFAKYFMKYIIIVSYVMLSTQKYIPKKIRGHWIKNEDNQYRIPVCYTVSHKIHMLKF